MALKKPRKTRITRNISTNAKTTFQRQELKFMVPLNVLDLLIPEFERYFDYDSHSNGGYYDVHSVYFDTQDWQAFYNKLDGIVHRKKFRIRSYSARPLPHEKIFVEIKEKNNDTVFKRRLPMSMDEINDLMQGKPGVKRSILYDEWRYNVVRNAIKPRLLNSYRRLAFSSHDYPGLRVTLDRDVSYAITHEVVFDSPVRPVNRARNYCVMEIKFDRYVPQFIVDILRGHDLTRTPISKYCDSVISHYLLI
jgi:SPX domain protein involved in polyphosphate accumulation